MKTQMVFTKISSGFQNSLMSGIFTSRNRFIRNFFLEINLLRLIELINGEKTINSSKLVCMLGTAISTTIATFLVRPRP